MKWIAVGLMLGAFVGCGSDAEESGGNTYQTVQGATCTVDGENISCTGSPPAMCGGTDTPGTSCWNVIGLASSPMQSCAGCCAQDGFSYNTDPGTCTEVVCDKDSDCGLPEATCKEGFCWCAVGKC